MNILAPSILTICLMAFVWGSFFFFRKDGTKTKWGGYFSIVVSIGAPSTLLLVWTCTQETHISLYLVASGLGALGLAIFLASVRAHGENPPKIANRPSGHPGFLVLAGPYQYVRHPFYLAYLCFWLGCAFACPGFSTGTLFCVAFFAYYRTIQAEEKELLELFGERYSDYVRATGALLPKLTQ